MYIPNNSSSKEDTDENNITVSPAGIAISIIRVIMLLVTVLIALVIVAITLRLCNKKQRSKPAAKSEHNLQTDTHAMTSFQPASRTEAVFNGHPSISSNDTGFNSLSDADHLSVTVQTIFFHLMTQSTDYFN